MEEEFNIDWLWFDEMVMEEEERLKIMNEDLLGFNEQEQTNVNTHDFEKELEDLFVKHDYNKDLEELF